MNLVRRLAGHDCFFQYKHDNSFSWAQSYTKLDTSEQIVSFRLVDDLATNVGAPVLPRLSGRQGVDGADDILSLRLVLHEGELDVGELDADLDGEIGRLRGRLDANGRPACARHTCRAKSSGQDPKEVVVDKSRIDEGDVIQGPVLGGHDAWLANP